MKRFLLIAMLGAGFGTTAQEPLQLKKMNAPMYRLNTDTSGDGLRNPNSIIQQRSLLPQATYSHDVSRGKIYNLPIDNMPCLVPDMQKVKPMPGQYMPVPESRMPNIIPRQRIIPAPKQSDQSRNR